MERYAHHYPESLRDPVDALDQDSVVQFWNSKQKPPYMPFGQRAKVIEK